MKMFSNFQLIGKWQKVSYGYQKNIISPDKLKQNTGEFGRWEGGRRKESDTNVFILQSWEARTLIYTW